MEFSQTTPVSEAPAWALRPQWGSPSALGGHSEDGGGDDDSEDGEGEEGDVEEEMIKARKLSKYKPTEQNKCVLQAPHWPKKPKSQSKGDSTNLIMMWSLN